MILRILLLLFIPFFIQAQTIEPGKMGTELITKLQQDYTPTNSLGYGPARDILYSEIDNVGNDLSGIYTNFTVTLDPNEDPSQSAFQQGINAEHVYPQSKGAGDEPQRADLHNIFPSKVNVNEVRGSCEFNDIEDSDTEKWFYLDMQVNSTPTSNINEYSEKDEEDCAFEPRESVKGDIARAMFYFYTIYQSEANSEDPNFFHNQKEKLLQWHLDDPVDTKEEDRNNGIAAEQGNLNPFIVDVTLAQRAYFPTTSNSNIEKENWVRISNTIIQNELTIFSKKENGEAMVFDIGGKLLMKKSLNNETVLNLEKLVNGSYILQVRTEDLAKVFRIIKL